MPRPGREALRIEHRPADLVAEALIVEDELSDLIRELCPLPPAFPPTRFDLLACGCGRPDRLDRIGGSAEFVGRHVGNGSGLAGSVGGMSSGPAQWSRRAHGPSAGGPGLHHPQLTAGPGTYGFDALTRPPIGWPLRLEKWQHVLGAGRGPQCQEPVVVIGERAAASDRDETRVAHLR